MRSLMRSLVAFFAIGVLATACGGSGGGQPPATSTGSVAANPCGIPVAAKCSTEAQALTGAGATFPAPIYTKWIDEYNKLTGVQINYQSVGSGGGIKSLTDKTVDFGASDVPLTDAQIDALPSPAYHIPAVMGAVVPTYNIPNVTATLKFTPDALAGIYLGTITKWNDPKITAENAGVSLPDLAITTVHRSDSSGTTGVFTDYLSKISADWKAKVGSATSVNWPGGVGGSGNAGVAGAVKNAPGTIGYVELIYALQNKLSFGVVKNAMGAYVEATLDSTSKAAEGVNLPDLANVKGQQAKMSITNANVAGSWPIATFTWLVVYKDIADKSKQLAMARYFWWGTHDGQAFTKDLGYAPLPAGVVTIAENEIKALSSGGAAVVTK